MKKVLATVLALVMVLALCTTSWAAETDVAKIGDTDYATLAEAITKAQANDTIVLLKEISENFSIPDGKTVVLDLNGKTITTAAQPTVIGELTIKGDGEITLEEAGIFLQGKLTLNGGTIHAKKNSDVIVMMFDSEFVMNDGKLLADAGACIDAGYVSGGQQITITGGTVETKDKGTNAIYLDTRSSTATNDKMDITGGTFLTGGQPTIGVNDESFEVAVTGGTYSNDVSEYVNAAGVPVAKRIDNSYVVGTSAVVAAANEDKSITIVKGNDAELTGVNSGVTVKVEGGGSVKVNDRLVTNDDTDGYTVPAKYYYYPSTSDTTTSTTTKGSPKTFDAGVGIYAVTAVLSVTGMAWTAKKRED